MRLALIDGDLLCYRVSAVFDETIDFGDGGSFRYLDKRRAVETANREVNDLADEIDADRVLVCLSDQKANFRKGIYGRYKSHRPKEKPPLVAEIRKALAEEWPTLMRHRLEADDVMGILSTDLTLPVVGHPQFWHRFKGDRVIVSADKDLRTIPGLLYNPMRPAEGIVEVDRLDADRAFYSQILTGDSVDNYPGCPGIGPKSKWVALINEAETERAMWADVVAGYESKGLTEKDAIIQARMARILRPGEYCSTSSAIHLWTPPDGTDKPQ